MLQNNVFHNTSVFYRYKIAHHNYAIIANILQTNEIYESEALYISQRMQYTFENISNIPTKIFIIFIKQNYIMKKSAKEHSKKRLPLL